MENIGLPVRRIGSQLFYDISGVVRPNRYERFATNAIDIHHSVGPAQFPDSNRSGTNADEEIAHIKRIDDMHWQWGYGGFGYQAITFPESRRTYVVGNTLGARAHVSGRNGEEVGICVAGDYSTKDFPGNAIFELGRFTLAQFELHKRLILVRGHRQAPRQSTSCPGDGGIRCIPPVLTIAEWIHKENQRR